MVRPGHGRRRRAPARPAVARARAGRGAATRRCWRSAASRAARAWASAARRACSAAVIRARRVALAAHRGGLLALARLERGEDALVVAGVVAPAAHGIDDQRVAVLHAAQELDALEHVGEALRVEHDRDDVGPVGRVALAQHRGQRAAALGQPRAQAHQPLARDAQLALGLGQARLPAREVALRLGQPRREDVDRPRRRALQAPQARGGRGELALAALLAVDVVAQRPGVLGGGEVRRPAGGGDGEQEHDGDRRRMACRESAAAHEKRRHADRRGPVQRRR